MTMLTRQHVKRLRNEMLDSARTLSMSLMITMRMFDMMPIADVRPSSAIVRQMPPPPRFDPRERLPGGVVLTMPFRFDGGLPARSDHPSLN